MAVDDFHFEILRPVLPPPSLGCLMTGVAVKLAKFLGNVISQPGPLLWNQLRNETTHIKRQSNFSQLLFKKAVTLYYRRIRKQS